MLPRDLIAKVRKIEIRTRKLVEDLTGGAYHSVFKGRGIEFSEVREYTTEDDVRDIDWNVTARMGAPYIKKYAEERELTVILAIDASASLFFGSGDETKREKVAETAALLAFSAIRNHDKVGLLVFTDRTELWLPPRSGRAHVLRLIRELLAFQPESRKTRIGNAMDSLIRNLKKRAVVFLFSDFIDNSPYERSMKILNRKHDLVAVRVLDREELALPPMPMLELEDAESGETLFFDASSAAERSRYARNTNAELAAEEETFNRAKVDLVDVRCGEDILKPLMAFFRRRKLRKG